MTAETPDHQLEVLLEQEAAAWRAVLAHLLLDVTTQEHLRALFDLAGQ